MTAAQEADALRLHKKGFSTQEIALRIGAHDRSAVWRVLQKHGVRVVPNKDRSNWTAGEPRRADRGLRKWSWQS